MNRRWLIRYLCYVLRHNPRDLGIILDERGWTEVTPLIEGLRRHKQFQISLSELERLVQHDHQSRYSLCDDRIRANSGHTLPEVRLVFEKTEPPQLLYYGIAKSRLHCYIEAGALTPDDPERYVTLCASAGEADCKSHCSSDEQPHIIVIEAAKAAQKGVPFFKSEIGEYLCESVPAEFFLDQRPDFRFQVSAGGVVVRDFNANYDAAIMRTRTPWELPKGKLQKGERGWEAARREVQEELGLTGSIRVGQRLDRVLYFFRNHCGQPRLKTVLLFLIHYQGSMELRPRKKEGVLAAEWVSFEEAQTRLLYSGGRYLRALETAQWLLRKHCWSKLNPSGERPRGNDRPQAEALRKPPCSDS